MKSLLLVSLLALSGCCTCPSSKPITNFDFQKCLADAPKYQIPEDKKGIYLKKCMSDKGYPVESLKIE
jgi:hypothetical protein